MTKLSILIPTYNEPCLTLVRALQRQCMAESIRYEIIVMDDASTDTAAIALNRTIADMAHCRLITLSENIGRARIRNQLVSEAKGEWCLMMDCDARVTHDNFIHRYLTAAYNATPGTAFIVGGLTNPDRLPSPAATLRYRYEKAAERQRHVIFRQRHPYLNFSTFNFMARRTALTAIPFCGDIHEYGYEDTLMGIELEARGIGIMHIDNSMEHTGFESNDVFLRKTETAIRTLATTARQLMPHTPLGKTVIAMRRCHLAVPFMMFFKMAEKTLRQNLTGRHPSMTAFKIYKTGILMRIMDRQQKGIVIKENTITGL